MLLNKRCSRNSKTSHLRLGYLSTEMANVQACEKTNGTQVDPNSTDLLTNNGEWIMHVQKNPTRYAIHSIST